MRTKVLLLLSALLLSLPLTAETLHEERSLYRDITVTQEGTRRCLVFNVHRGDRNPVSYTHLTLPTIYSV